MSEIRLGKRVAGDDDDDDDDHQLKRRKDKGDDDDHQLKLSKDKDDEVLEEDEDSEEDDDEEEDSEEDDDEEEDSEEDEEEGEDSEEDEEEGEDSEEDEEEEDKTFEAWNVAPEIETVTTGDPEFDNLPEFAKLALMEYNLKQKEEEEEEVYEFYSVKEATVHMGGCGLPGHWFTITFTVSKKKNNGDDHSSSSSSSSSSSDEASDSALFEACVYRYLKNFIASVPDPIKVIHCKPVHKDYIIPKRYKTWGEEYGEEKDQAPMVGGTEEEEE